MSKSQNEKYFDTRTVNRYLKKGLVSDADYKKYLESLPNDEDNFDLSSLDDDEIGVADLSEEEIAAMEPMSENEIDNFDFMESEETPE